MKLFLTRAESAALRRCISMLDVSRSGFALSLLLGVSALSAAIALGGTAAWSLRPRFASLVSRVPSHATCHASLPTRWR